MVGNDAVTSAMHVVAAVIVTYGDRWRRYGERAAIAALGAGARHVIVVNNSTEPLVNADSRVEILERGENTGSAAGYATGIAHAVTGGADYIWLLDDDNWSEPDALACLVRENLRETEQRGGQPGATVAYRRRLGYQSDALRGVPTRFQPPIAGSFLGFDAVTAIGRRLYNWTQARNTQMTAASPVPLRFFPYGGTLIRREIVEQVGLPDARFVVFADDVAWSRRVLAAGFWITLVPTAIVNDADEDDRTRVSGLRRTLIHLSTPLLYYSVRNPVYLAHHDATDAGVLWRYRANRLVMLVRVGAMLRSERRAALRTFWQAVADGEAGAIGAIYSL